MKHAQRFFTENWLIIALWLALLIVHFFVATVFTVDGKSMDDTLHHGQRIVGIRHFDIDRFDIVVLKSPINEKSYVKRVIGLPCDTIEIKDDILYINDKEVEEPYLAQKKAELTSYFNKNIPRTRIPEGHVYVIGDNRQNSLDSRELGPIDQHNVYAEIIYRIWPFDQFGKIE